MTLKKWKFLLQLNILTTSIDYTQNDIMRNDIVICIKL